VQDGCHLSCSICNKQNQEKKAKDIAHKLDTTTESLALNNTRFPIAIDL
jgi:hypothetical protein